MTVEFEPFPKIARATTDVTITEKIDGTNACVRIIPEEDERAADIIQDAIDQKQLVLFTNGCGVMAGSRKRWITPEDDNFGFAQWVSEHAEWLTELGPGLHRGEWWGGGIQRGYGLPKGDRRFSLFNTHKWGAGAEQPPPSCCHVVPVVARTTILDLTGATAGAEIALRTRGSAAAPGFMHPEGLMLYLHGPGVFVKHPWSK